MKNEQVEEAVNYAKGTNSLEEQQLTKEEEQLIIESIKEKESTKEFLKTVKEIIKETKGEKISVKNRK